MEEEEERSQRREARQRQQAEAEEEAAAAARRGARQAAGGAGGGGADAAVEDLSVAFEDGFETASRSSSVSRRCGARGAVVLRVRACLRAHAHNVGMRCAGRAHTPRSRRSCTVPSLAWSWPGPRT